MTHLYPFSFQFPTLPSPYPSFLLSVLPLFFFVSLVFLVKSSFLVTPVTVSPLHPLPDSVSQDNTSLLSVRKAPPLFLPDDPCHPYLLLRYSVCFLSRPLRVGVVGIPQFPHSPPVWGCRPLTRLGRVLPCLCHPFDESP